MQLIIILSVLLLLFVGGFYVGPGVGYHGGGGVSIVWLLVILFLLFGRVADGSNRNCRRVVAARMAKRLRRECWIGIPAVAAIVATHPVSIGDK